VDPVRQSAFTALAMPTPMQNFEGQTADDSGCNCIPPDTNGAVGPTQYVQMVNSSLSVYNKTGTRLSGPTQINAMFSALPSTSQCRLNNNGDPVVVYDQLADRWLVSQFAVPGGAAGYHECIAISQTGDATGAYYVYDYLVGGSNKFQDYPHFGLWPDGYYMSTHQFDPNNYSGAGVFAFERDKMLVGNPAAQMIYFDLGPVNLAFGGHLPATLDGRTLPPAGSPEYFVEVDDSADIGPADAMRIWKFHVDWANPANSTFGLNGQPNSVVAVADFTRPPCILGLDQGNCVPQPASETQLDPIGDRLMYRAAYRNFGDHEAIVINHTVVADATTMQHGPRWYEVRDPGGSPSIYQQGTLAPSGPTDVLHRWMSSIAMDHNGNMAIGYSTSSNTDFPSIAYAGRLVSDPLNQLAQSEVQMFAGGGSENPFLFIGAGLGRWGDYSDMTVDPTDDCTFWYTQEYFPTPVDLFTTWHTRIGSFKFPTCVAGPPQLVSVVSRKNHGGLTPPGDLVLTTSGPATIECRTGGNPSGDHALVFKFLKTLTGVGSVTAAATTSSGTQILTPTGNIGTDAHEYLVTLTGVPNASHLTVTLHSVADSSLAAGDISAHMDVLLGDVSLSGRTDAGDVTQVRNRTVTIPDTTDPASFRYDVNASGRIDAGDVTTTRNATVTVLPP
jgi:hypothetical protein